ncbi:MAG: hypothetical protein IPI67_01035 [Myxococcales bacterium]|nr:hypothetical protein [Myxococcales bacterium]
MLRLEISFCLLAVLALGCGDNKTEAPKYADYQGAEPTALACVPNLDGRIDASEARPAIGAEISYLVSPAGGERAVDIAGTDLGNGRIRWDFATDFADDQRAVVVPAVVAGKWYQAAFPPDAFVTPFDAAGTIENIVRHDDTALWLLGVASRDEAPPEGKTLLVYDAPVEILRFPIEPGGEFVSAGTVKNGTLRGLPYAGKDTYEVSVDAVGEVVLPALAFTQAHRVRTKVTVAPAVGASTSRRQVSFFFECFAEVARATSKPDEPDADFMIAAELRRIGF